MNWLCWLFDHDWTFPAAASTKACCRRCDAEPYDDVTLPEVFRNTRIVPRVKWFAASVRLWLRSRKCWKPGHDWSPTSCYCQRCGLTGIQVSESPEWTLPEWKKLWRGWLHDRFHVVKPYLNDQVLYAVQTLGWRWGIEKSNLYIRGDHYMVRYIAYLGPIGLRLHKFMTGDDDSAPHTHPWAFITFPLHSYVEALYEKGAFKRFNVVKKFRFHYRPATHEHIVKGPMFSFGGPDVYYRGAPLYSTAPGFEPFWTIVIMGHKSNDWGFYPKPGKFVHWRDYKPGERVLGVKA